MNAMIGAVALRRVRRAREARCPRPAGVDAGPVVDSAVPRRRRFAGSGGACRRWTPSSAGRRVATSWWRRPSCGARRGGHDGASRAGGHRAPSSPRVDRSDRGRGKAALRSGARVRCGSLCSRAATEGIREGRCGSMAATPSGPGQATIAALASDREGAEHDYGPCVVRWRAEDGRHLLGSPFRPDPRAGAGASSS